MPGRPWTDLDRAAVLSEREANPTLSWEQIGWKFGRSASACAAQYHIERKKRGEAKQRPRHHQPEPFMLRVR